MPVRRSSYHHGALREALVQAGREALAVGSADSLSLRELSRAIGVTPGAAYQHFRSKDELLEALAADGFRQLHGALRSDGSASLERLAQTYLDFTRHHAALAALMFRPRLLGRGSRATLDEAIGECLAEFVAAVSRDRGARVRDRENPEEAIQRAVIVWSTLQGFASLTAAHAFGTLDRWMLPDAETLLAASRSGA